MTLGPLMIGLRGPELEAAERERLRHPLTGGVILFARNYVDREQLRALVAEVHALRSPRLLVAVDHEGGPVQRFRAGFTPLPPCAALGALYDAERAAGLRLAEDCGWLMAAELREVGVDLSLAPVLDLGTGVSTVIGERAFHRDAEAVAALGYAYVRGMRAAGMAAVGKHFPGHGSVAADSHQTTPVDERDYEAIAGRDLRPFAHLVRNGIEAIMAAHVVYPRVDARPAAFSPLWLGEVLRRRLGFAGAILSDDIGMGAAAVVGDLLERAQAALAAGCDMILMGNEAEGAGAVFDGLKAPVEPLRQLRLIRLHGRPVPGIAGLRAGARWRQVASRLESLQGAAQLDLADEGPR